MRIVGFAYVADIHCMDCAREDFGEGIFNESLEDREGNPVHPIFEIDESALCHCGDCGERLIGN